MPGEMRHPVVYRVCVLGSGKLHFGGHRNFDHTSQKDLLPLNVAVVFILPTTVELADDDKCSSFESYVK